MSSFQVIKRDGREVELNVEKIYNAIKKAYKENFDGVVEERKIQALSDKVFQCIEAKLIKDADLFDGFGFIQIWRNVTYAHYYKKNINGEGSQINLVICNS